MGTLVPTGAIAHYTGTWPAGFITATADSLVGQLGVKCAQSGLTFVNYTITDGGGLFGAAFQNTIGVAINIQNDAGVNLTTDDILGIVASWAPTILNGQLPITQTVTDVSTPGQGTISTNQPGQTAPGTGAKNIAHTCGDPSWGILDDPGQWFSCLTTKGLSTLGLVFIGLALGLVLVVTSKRVNPL